MNKCPKLGLKIVI